MTAKVLKFFAHPFDDPENEVRSLESCLGINLSLTRLIRVVSEPMERTDIYPEDILLVERDAEPGAGDLIVTLKRGQLFVFPVDEATPGSGRVCGVVTHVIRKRL